MFLNSNGVLPDFDGNFEEDFLKDHAESNEDNLQKEISYVVKFYSPTYIFIHVW